MKKKIKAEHSKARLYTGYNPVFVFCTSNTMDSKDSSSF